MSSNSILAVAQEILDGKTGPNDPYSDIAKRLDMAIQSAFQNAKTPEAIDSVIAEMGEIYKAGYSQLAGLCKTGDLSTKDFMSLSQASGEKYNDLRDFFQEGQPQTVATTVKKTGKNGKRGSKMKKSLMMKKW